MHALPRRAGGGGRGEERRRGEELRRREVAQPVATSDPIAGERQAVCTYVCMYIDGWVGGGGVG